MKINKNYFFLILSVFIFSFLYIIACSVISVPTDNDEKEKEQMVFIPKYAKDLDSRIIDWQPGINGGIPVYPVGVNVKNYGALGDGAADDTAAINASIAACPPGQAVLLPAGTYKVTGELLINKSIVLRGEGWLNSRLINYSLSGNIISISRSAGNSSTDVLSGYQKGSMSLTVSNADAFNVNDYIYISQNNDPVSTFNMQSYQIRAVAQIVKITTKSGNILNINRPLYYDYNGAMDIRITGSSGVNDAGIEDLYIERANPGGLHNILILKGHNCWVKNVYSYKTNKWHVRLEESYGCVVRECIMNDAHQHGGDCGYGAGCICRSTDNLIENNIFIRLRHSMLLEWGGAGNVFGYNYSADPINENGSNTDWLMADICVHGGHSYLNLFEGNAAAHIDCDNYLGSSEANTFFRNQIGVKSIPSVLYGLWAVEVQANNLYVNVVGNVLGTPSIMQGSAWRIGFDRLTSDIDKRVSDTIIRHYNYNYFTDSLEIDPDLSGAVIPDSYYLTGKPDFFGGKPWPITGPDCLGAGSIPAYDRYLTL